MQIKKIMPSHILKLFGRMTSAATGPLVSFLVLLALPLCGAALLPTDQFAIWTILSTITTVALSLDFGGVALTSARFGTNSPAKLILQASALSSIGSLAVGLVSALLWIPYSATAAADAFSFEEGLAAIGLCSLASIFRSTLAVLAQACLHLEKPKVRMFLTAGQAFLCFAVAFGILLISPSAWALPVGWAISSSAVLAVGLLWMGLSGAFRYAPHVHGGFETSTFSFVWSRTVASLLGAAFLQGDRWIIGAVAGPEFLAAYEVAWRVAVLPRFLIQNLAIAISGDAGKIFRTTPRKLKAILFNTTMICIVVAILSCGVVSLFYFAFAQNLNVRLLPVEYVVLLVAFTIYGITAPLSFLAIAIGLPSLDIPYLVLTAVLCALSAVGSFVADSATTFVIGNSLAIVSGALWYLHYGRRRVIRRCQQATRMARLRLLESA